MEKWYPADSGALNQIYNGEKEKCPQIVIQVNITEKIDPDILATALNKSFRDFPVFSVQPALNEKGEPGFVADTQMAPVFPFGQAHDYGSDEIAGHTIYAEYQENKMFLNFHHVVTDGCGAMNFAACVLCNYLFEAGLTSTAEFTPGVQPTDTEDPFEKHGDIDAQVPFFVPRNNEFTLPYKMQYRKEYPLYSYSFRFNITELLRVSKKAEASVLPVMIGLICRSLHHVYDVGSKTIVGTTGCDSRKFYNSRTPKNFAQAFPIAFAAKEMDMSLELQATCQRGMVDMYMQKETLDFNLADTYVYFRDLDKTKFLETIQDTALWDQRRAAGEGRSAYFLSYFGKFNVPGYALPFIKNVTGYVSGTRSPLTMTAIALGDIMNLTIIQNFDSDEFVEGLKKELASINIDADLRFEGLRKFENSICFKQL